MSVRTDQSYICYCTNGHPVNLKGRYMPSACPICNAPMNLSIMPSPPASSTPQEVCTPVPEPRPAQPVQSPSAQAPQEPIARPVPGIAVRSMPPAPRMPDLPDAGHAPQRIPRISPDRPASPAVIQPPEAPLSASLQLDYFGEKIAIPPVGGWLGRSALGAAHFQGNLLISREHVFVKPGEDGSLMVGPDKSLNGVFITHQDGKIRLEPGHTDCLREGDVLWLYNIPLKTERKQQ